MILRTKSQNLVLFGVEEINNFLNAEFCLYSEGLPEKTVVFSSNYPEGIKIYIPNEIKNKLLPGLSQYVTFLKVDANTGKK